MVNNINNIITQGTTICHLKHCQTQKKTMTYGIGNPGPAMGQAQKQMWHS